MTLTARTGSFTTKRLPLKVVVAAPVVVVAAREPVLICTV